MKTTNNILSKIFLFLILAAGWGSCAWAQRISPVFAAEESATDKVWHFITFPQKSNARLYANEGNGKLSWGTATPDDNYKWYLIGNQDNFILKSVTGKYVYTTQTGTGRETQYQITSEASSATHFNLVNGNNGTTWAIHRMGGDAGNNINHRGGNVLAEWTVDAGCSVTFANSTTEICLSEEPSMTDWAPGTKWFTWRSNRSNQPANDAPTNNHNRHYLSTSANSVDNDHYLTPVSPDAPTDRGGYWAFAGNNETGFQIYNAAYGPAFVLAYTNSKYAMVPKNNIPQGAQTVFTYDYSTVIDAGAYGYTFRIGTSGVNHIHCSNSVLSAWNNGSNGHPRTDDTGSSFMVTLVEDATFNALPEYDVYKVETNAGAVSYGGSREVFGKRDTSPFFILAKGDPEVTQADIQTSRDIESFSTDYSQSSTYLKIINIELSFPLIIHRQHGTFNHLSEVGAAQKPNSKFIQEGQGLIDHPYAAGFTDAAGYTENDRKMQNTSVFHLTQYAKKGETTKVRMPFRRERDGSVGKINKYQRWYDYKTERCLDEDIVQGLSGYTMYYNGIAKTGVTGIVDIKLPNDKEEIFVGVDNSEFNDYSTDSEGNLIEPSLSMRTIIHVVSAEKMASALVAKGGADKWWEEKTYIVPNIKRGSATHRNNSDLLPLEMPFSNYWIYDNSHNLMRIVNENGNYSTLENNLSIVVEGTAASYITAGIFKEAGNQTTGPGLHDPAGVSCNHFIYYKVKGDGLTREVPAGSQAIIKIYARNGVSGTEYQLAKFTLNFQADCEPLAITSVVGNENSTRSRDYFLNQKMAEVASLTFSEKKVGFKGFGGVGGSDTHYAFPLDPTRTSYAFSPDDAFGGYRITKSAYGMKVLPVSLYERNIKNQSTSLTVDDDDYYLYIDAAETPGQVASIPLDGNLCAGTRLFFYGWLNSQNPSEAGNATAASVILELVGRKAGKDVILATYLPGVVSDAAYTPEGTVIRSVKDGSTASTEAAYSFSYNLDGHGADATRIAAWQSIGFSYLLTESGFDGFELRVINNCYSTAGGDYSLDDFRVFVNPPKGSVDFTTPLCSDKVRHAKIHSDFDMLKNISNVNETTPGAKLSVSCCFLEADVFDNYSAGGLTISDIFEVDAQTGNHNLKAEYRSDPAAITLINNAFGKALVGTRQLASADPEKGGFHTFDISLNYESIPVYAYNDSQNEVVYREEGTDGIRRIVFKEDVIRGEMAQIEYDGQKHYPHMRPSTTYYLVFAPNPVDNDDISDHTVGTKTFLIQDNCSFFGKFTTKDPLHVILDNADIESDLPVRAVCNGETAYFSFDMPTMKASKPIVDEAYCVSEESLNGKIVPESQGLNHYKYEASFKSNDISGVIKNLPYDWWMGGLEFDNETTYRGTIEDYLAAQHPTIKYNEPKDKAHKQHGDPVNIAQAMTDFRFFYPDFGMGKWDANGNSTLTDADWATVTKKDYNSDTGYGLLESEINSIKDLVGKGIIILHRNTYDMPLTYEEAEELQAKELNDMMEKEMNDQILALALQLDNEPSIAALLPLKALEGTVLSKLSEEGRLHLTLEELASMTYEQVKGIAAALKTNGKLTDVTDEQINAMTEGELRRTVEEALKAMSDSEMQAFASNESNFPNIGHEKRAYLVVRALNILSRETVAKLPEADQQNTTIVRAKLREQMISIFSAQQVEVLRKMWSDVSAKLTEEERAALLKDELHPETPKNPATMNADGLAVLVEDGLAQLTNNVIDDLQGDRYVHFTLVPIMPSQETFVDEPYIFCPEPRGVKLRITSHAPRMIDGFADMPYPEDMDNVPVRLGLTQIKETKESTGKNLRIPVRGLKKAAKDGEKAIKLSERTGYYTDIFLTETDDPQYQQTPNAGVLSDAKNVEGIYTRMVGKVNAMVAVYPTAVNQNPDNYLEVSFENDMVFREGYTYRVGVNYMEVKEVEVEGVKVEKPTISCPGEMLLDLKIVPEYQKWTASVNSDWTNDQNWARASRAELNAGNAAAGDKIDDKATDLDDASSYIDNDGDGGNGTANAFVPMYFTNVLIDKDASAPVLYTEKETEESDAYTPASRSGKTFLKGLHSTATDRIIYDMEVAPANGKGTWPVSEGDYECTLFGTYIANGVTFEPGAQLGNAHYLTYNKAWVEYELDADRWYTVGSPLKKSVAGDWYSPTAGGKQLTPHFYDINYSETLNDRYRPAYYQRSWDRNGNNVVYTKAGGTYDSYVRADWSNVYNDATVNYNAGGFSVKAELDYMDPADRPADGKVLVRLPKADTSYTYYDVAGETGSAADANIGLRNESYRLLSDDLGADGAGSITMSVSNNTIDNNFLLLSNPFMATMDMDKFFAANTDLEEKYWIVDADHQMVSLKNADSGEWITTSDAGGKYVAPLQGFFVKKKDAALNPGSINASYTAAMQTVVNPGVSLRAPASRSAVADIDVIRLVAERNGAESTALIVLNENAHDGYVVGEDCETFLDGNLETKPNVYTAAAATAQSINVRKTLDMVPVGIISTDDSPAVLRFDLSDSSHTILYLYDSETESYTTVNDGTEVTMSGNNAGRYFIVSEIRTILDDDATEVSEAVELYNLHGIRVATSQRGTVTIRGSRKEFRR